MKMVLTGCLGNDCDIREIGNKKVLNFNVAVNQDYKDGNGLKVEKTEWVKASLWKSEEQSLRIADYLKKGVKVYLEGAPSSEAYSSKENEIKSSLHLTVNSLELL